MSRRRPQRWRGRLTERVARTRVVAAGTGRPPRRFVSMSFPATVSGRLRGALVRAHARQPFAPSQPRDAADRCRRAAEEVGLHAIVVRGVVNVGGAELDHLWVVADDHVIDASLPVNAPSFVAAVRAYVAGDLDDDELDRAAHAYSLRWRVVGEYPDSLRYLGLPVWHQRQRPAASWATRSGR